MRFTQLAACFAQLLTLENYWSCLPELSGKKVLKKWKWQAKELGKNIICFQRSSLIWNPSGLWITLTSEKSFPQKLFCPSQISLVTSTQHILHFPCSRMRCFGVMALGKWYLRMSWLQSRKLFEIWYVDIALKHLQAKWVTKPKPAQLSLSNTIFPPPSQNVLYWLQSQAAQNLRWPLAFKE